MAVEYDVTDIRDASVTINSWVYHNPPPVASRSCCLRLAVPPFVAGPSRRVHAFALDRTPPLLCLFPSAVKSLAYLVAKCSSMSPPPPVLVVRMRVPWRPRFVVCRPAPCPFDHRGGWRRRGLISCSVSLRLCVVCVWLFSSCVAQPGRAAVWLSIDATLVRVPVPASSLSLAGCVPTNGKRAIAVDQFLCRSLSLYLSVSVRLPLRWSSCFNPKKT
jgi:hypothetical protein